MRFGKLPLALLALTCVIAPYARSGDWIVFAEKGDTLWDLCLKYTNKRGCWIELAKYNSVSNDRAIPVGTAIRIPSAWLISPPRVGTVTAVAGEVDYYKVSSTKPVDLQQGQPLFLGDRLVSRGGSGSISLGAGRELLVRPGTTIHLNTMSGSADQRHEANLDVPEGEVEVKIKAPGESRFRISTPAAIAAVRGTHYRVNSRADSMRGEVLTGSVEIAAGNAAQLVPAGFGLAARKGAKPGNLRRLLAAPVFAGSYATVNLPVALEWSGDSAATSWVLDVLEDREGGALLQSHVTASPGYTLESLKEGCYRLQLRAVDSEGFNGMPADLSMCIVPRLPAVIGLSTHVSNTSADVVRLSWRAVTGARAYRVETATDGTFAEITGTRETSATEMEVNLPADSSYSVRVVALDAAGNGSLPSAPVEIEPAVDMPWGFFMLLFALMVSLV